MRLTNAIHSFKDIAEAASKPSEIEVFLDLIPKLPAYAQFRQLILYTKKELIQNLLDRENSSSFKILNKKANVFFMSSNVGRDDRKISGTFALLPTPFENIFRLTSISYSPFWEEIVKRFVKRLYPDAMPVFFKQAEIKKALMSLEFSLGKDFRIRVSEATTKEEKVSRRRYDTERRWTNLSIADVFNLAAARSQWFVAIRFLIEKRVRPDKEIYRRVAAGRISNFGEVKFDRLYKEFVSNVNPILESSAAARLNFLDGRGLRERNYEPSKPIEITYASDVFATVEEVRRFGAVMQKYPNATKAVLHANPYYHSNIADFLDGSSFEVWIVSPRNIVLIPQAKASEQAFERMISYIFSEFKEGEINGYE